VLLAGLSEQEAVRGGAGWGGDRAFLFEHDKGSKLFVWKTVWDRREDAEEFFRAYNALQQRRNHTQANRTTKSGDEAQAVWREDGQTTLVQLAGESVIILRGAEAEIDAALSLACR
jgi:hypothetical protein